MNTREVTAEVARLAAERGWDEDDPRAETILSLLGAREDARHSLRSHVRSLRRDLDRLDAILAAESPLLNDLGELQQRPAAVEAAVGAFAAADSILRRYLETFPAKPVTPAPEEE
jgi:NAD(P)H-dependent FMN reductase